MAEPRMTIEEVKIKTILMKTEAFDMLVMLERDEDMRRNAGYKTRGDLLDIIKSTRAKIEKELRLFEKENPDDH